MPTFTSVPALVQNRDRTSLLPAICRKLYSKPWSKPSTYNLPGNEAIQTSGLPSPS